MLMLYVFLFTVISYAFHKSPALQHFTSIFPYTFSLSFLSLYNPRPPFF